MKPHLRYSAPCQRRSLAKQLAGSSCSGSCVYTNFPEQSCLDKTLPYSASREKSDSGRARSLHGSSPRAEPPTDEKEHINIMEFFPEREEDTCQNKYLPIGQRNRIFHKVCKESLHSFLAYFSLAQDLKKSNLSQTVSKGGKKYIWRTNRTLL